MGFFGFPPFAMSSCRMIFHLKSCIWIGLGMLILGSAAAQVLPERMLSGLKSEQFKVREQAQAEMLEWARANKAAAMDELFQQSQSAEDPEQRVRCLAVLRELVLEEFELQGEGFVGVQMLDVLATLKKGDKPEALRAVRITQILPGMAAEAAGLKVNDTILGLNGTRWSHEVASVSFMDSIKKTKPGTKVRLEVLRVEELREVEVTLCRRPDLNAVDPRFGLQPERIEARKQAEKDAYFRNWLEQRRMKDD